MKPADPRFRVLYAVWAFLEIIGYGGLIYGWGSLVYVLKDEGLYMELCPAKDFDNMTVHVGNSTVVRNITDQANSSGVYIASSSPPATGKNEKNEDTCDARDARLNLVFTIGSAMFCIGCFIMGQVNYKYGTRITRIIAAIVFIIGALLIAFTSKGVPWLIFPGLSLIGGAGITFLMTNMQISLLFPKLGSVVVGIFCGAFDASTGTQLLVKLGYEGGVSRQTSYLILAVFHLLTLISTFFFLPKDFIKKSFIHNPSAVEDEKDGEVAVKMTSNGKNQEPDPEEEEVNPSLMSQMFSLTYILHVYWLSVLQLRFYFLLGSLNKMLENLLDSKDEVSRYTNETTYILICGLFTSPLAGAFYALQNRFFVNSLSPLRRNLMPTVLPLALTTILGILMSAIILIEEATIIYAVFVCLLFFRSFLYTMGAGLLSAIYPSEYFGIMYGIMFIVSGIVSMFQYGLFAWAEAAGFFQVNVFLLVLMFTTFCHPLYQWWASRKAERALSF
ncbi:solute carrier family 43 member 3 [Plakobranchus ocellatus]|uniref:Solute carrier family 43 member 3 n=1 Tax=Plakobranchus ocellatus TaxID=259542 RepID=A0AAV4BK29_9GAST|nr:solute carrier family 43 member 3 [Plakobranchus ocellatus]